MRRSILTVALCVSAVSLIAARCSGDDESASAQKSESDETPAQADAPAAAAVTGEGASAPADPNAKEPDDLFKDPLDSGSPSEPSADALDEMGGTPAPETDAYLDDPSFQPEPMPEAPLDAPSEDLPGEEPEGGTPSVP